MSNSDIPSHYDNYYLGKENRWREICARSKAANVMALWRRVDVVGAPQSIIEIGCGDGALIQALDQRNFGTRYRGLEISKSAIEIARRRVTKAPCEWLTVTAGAGQLPDNSADLVILSHVLEHATDPRSLLTEAFRLARYVFVEVPLEDTWGHSPHFAWADLGHINFYSSRTIRWLVESAIVPSSVRVLAESVSCPARDTFVFAAGPVKGSLKWAIKYSLLRVAPLVASRLLTYHGALIATR